MPDRIPDQAVGGSDATNDAGPAKAAEDISFEARGARLKAELARYDRARAGCRGFEYGHDESYTPGYHQGGVRFGFFNGHEDRQPLGAPSPDVGKDHKG